MGEVWGDAGTPAGVDRALLGGSALRSRSAGARTTFRVLICDRIKSAPSTKSTSNVRPARRNPGRLLPECACLLMNALAVMAIRSL